MIPLHFEALSESWARQLRPERFEEANAMLRVICSLVVLAGVFLSSNVRGLEMVFSKDDVGQLWLQIMGRIDDGDDVKFRNMLIDAIDRDEQIANVSIYSPGGRGLPAMKIGRYIRTMRLSTVAPQLVPLLGEQICDIHTMSGRTNILKYDPRRNRGDPRCTCAGECFLIWAAGTTRLGSAVQIHRISLQGDDDAKLSGAEATDMHASGQEIIADYLREMGIPRVTIDRIFSLSPDKIEYLTQDERDVLAYKTDQELFNARCRHHAATSPAALACERAVIRELYWEGAQRILSQSD
jgi:hypothetical protein